MSLRRAEQKTCSRVPPTLQTVVASSACTRAGWGPLRRGEGEGEGEEVREEVDGRRWMGGGGWEEGG